MWNAYPWIEIKLIVIQLKIAYNKLNSYSNKQNTSMNVEL